MSNIKISFIYNSRERSLLWSYTCSEDFFDAYQKTKVVKDGNKFKLYRNIDTDKFRILVGSNYSETTNSRFSITNIRSSGKIYINPTLKDAYITDTVSALKLMSENLEKFKIKMLNKSI